MGADNQLRITFIAGGLTKGGAEKQFIYMLQALKELNVELQVLTITQGEYHEESLRGLGIEPIYLGSDPARRIWNIRKVVQVFRPHFIQASHFFASFYAGLAGLLTGTPSIGAIRGDLYHDLQSLGSLGKFVLRLPTLLMANSYQAQKNAHQIGMNPTRLFVVQNVIDLADFDIKQKQSLTTPMVDSNFIRVVTVARLVPVKRLERFLKAIAIARRQAPNLQGIIVGSGPEEAALHSVALDLGLLGSSLSEDGSVTRPITAGVHFLGERHDIPQILNTCHICALTSDREGFPNVLLEAMAASLPILSTPAGEAPDIVRDGINGYLVPFDEPEVLADHLVQLTKQDAERLAMGQAGRKMVENLYSYSQLKHHLWETYQAMAQQINHQKALAIFHTPRDEKKTPSVFQTEGVEQKSGRG